MDKNSNGNSNNSNQNNGGGRVQPTGSPERRSINEGTVLIKPATSPKPPRR